MNMLKAAIYMYIAFIVTTFYNWQIADGQLCQDQKDFILMRHNQLRSQVSPTASIMLRMVCSRQIYIKLSVIIK